MVEIDKSEADGDPGVKKKIIEKNIVLCRQLEREREREREGQREPLLHKLGMIKK